MPLLIKCFIIAFFKSTPFIVPEIIPRLIINAWFTIPSKKSSAQVGVWVNSVLIRNGYIKCYIFLFKEIILQQCDAFQTVIQDSLMKLCAFKGSRGHPSKMVKLPIMSPELKHGVLEQSMIAQ